MKKVILFILLATLCLFFKAEAQFYEPSDKTIRMGETLPESFFQINHQAVNAKTGKPITIQLQQYRNKLIILDFWASWCGPCIYSMGKLDSLQKAMDTQDFEVIPVTYQPANEAISVFSKHKWDVKSIVADTTLAQIFPHSGIPHQVWIRNGRVMAFPKWDYATSENIANAAAGKPVKMTMNIQDRVLDPGKPLFANGNGEAKFYFKGPHSVIARYQTDYRAERLTFVKQKDTSILYANNQSIQQLFYDAFENRIFPVLDRNNGVVWEASDKLKERLFNRPRPSTNGNNVQDSIYNNWIKRNSYGYYLRYPAELNDSAAKAILQKDLNSFFGFYMNLTASIQNSADQRFLVLRTLKNAHNATLLLKTKGAQSVNEHTGDYRQYFNRPFRSSMLLSLKAAGLAGKLQLVDSTGIDPELRVDYSFPKTIKGDLLTAQKELAKYGLSLSIEEMSVPLLVIRQKGYKGPSSKQYKN